MDDIEAVCCICGVPVALFGVDERNRGQQIISVCESAECRRRLHVGDIHTNPAPQPMPPLLRWTTEKPTAPGWWWTRMPDFPPQILEVREVAGGLMVVYGDYLSPVEKEPGEWAGPIEPPEG